MGLEPSWVAGAISVGTSDNPSLAERRAENAIERSKKTHSGERRPSRVEASKTPSAGREGEDGPEGENNEPASCSPHHPRDSRRPRFPRPKTGDPPRLLPRRAVQRCRFTRRIPIGEGQFHPRPAPGRRGASPAWHDANERGFSAGFCFTISVRNDNFSKLELIYPAKPLRMQVARV